MSYARQCPMVALLDAGSIPAGSTKLHWLVMSEGCVNARRSDVINGVPVKFRQHQCNTAGPIWIRQRKSTVGSSCRGGNAPYSAGQTKNAKSILVKVAGFLKSLVPDFSFGEFVPAATAA